VWLPRGIGSDKEKIVEKILPDNLPRFFERAFWDTAVEVDASNEAKARLLSELIKAFSRGEPRLGDRAADTFFSQGYAWPRYSEYLKTVGIGANPYKRGMLFNHRITMMAYARHHEASRLRNIESRPLWEFSAIDDDRTPSDCLACNGTIRRFDDSFWDLHPIPCEHLFCRCTIISRPSASKIDS
jgi:SPP1 gp7 family putative phage head morphogenesis protein